MLNQTRYTKQEIIEAGILKKDLRVFTPIDYKSKGWGNTKILVYNSGSYVRFKIIRRLLKLSYGVVISIKDNKPSHLSIFTDYTMKGLSVFNLNKNEYIYTHKGIKQDAI